MIQLITNWWGKQPNWPSYEIRLDHLDYSARVQQYAEVVSWIYDRTENPNRHAQWIFTVNTIHVKFRYEKDYLMFVLVWGDNGY